MRFTSTGNARTLPFIRHIISNLKTNSRKNETHSFPGFVRQHPQKMDAG